MISIVVISRQSLIRHGIEYVCVPAAGMRVVGAATQLSSGVSLIDRLAPDVTIIDLLRPSDATSGLSSLDPLVARPTAVLALIDQRTPLLTMDLLEAGVAGVIDRSDTAQDVHRAVETIDGGRLFPHAGPAWNATTPPTGRPAPLTARESEVLGLVTAGLTNRDIGSELHITESTVKFHVSSLIRKLDVPRRIDLVRLALRSGAY